MTNEQLNKANIIPLSVLCLFLALILLIPLRIIGYGYLPPDDALRHAAKVVSGKSWNDILVLRPGIIVDTHPGWHAILSIFHRLTNCDADGLVTFSVCLLFILFSIFPIIFLQRLESWLLALIIAYLTVPHYILRLLMGRPYIFTMSILIFILFAWTKLEKKSFPTRIFISTALLIALSTWVHGSWVLFVIPLSAFLLAREWKKGLVMGISFLTGILLGAIFTGHPWRFLAQDILHILHTFTSHKLTRMLVLELLPASGETRMITMVLLMLIWRALRRKWDIKRLDNPVFILAVSCWIMSFITQRFFSDWGLVALLVWLAQEFDEFFEAQIDYFSLKRLLLTTVIGITLFFMYTVDLNDRWTNNLSINYLSQDNPAQKEWLPEPGGIVYSADMTIFYQTFYKNPRSPWCYILGFEATMMPEDDLAIFRNIQRNFGALEAYKPWMKKMKPADRLVIRGSGQFIPNLPELEWNYTAKGIWVGRLPKKPTTNNKLEKK